MNLPRIFITVEWILPIASTAWASDLGYPVLQRFTESKGIAFGCPHFRYARLELGKWQAGENVFRAGAGDGGKVMARVMTKTGKEGLRPIILPIGFMGVLLF